MRSTIMAMAFVAPILLAGGVSAHHGWGNYDAKKKFTITSSVQKLEWANPHVHIIVAHEGKMWEAVLAPPFRMSARGLDRDMIVEGAQVSVEGYPSTKVETELRAERIVVGGKTFELR